MPVKALVQATNLFGLYLAVHATFSHLVSDCVYFITKIQRGFFYQSRYNLNRMVGFHKGTTLCILWASRKTSAFYVIRSFKKHLLITSLSLTYIFIRLLWVLLPTSLPLSSFSESPQAEWIFKNYLEFIYSQLYFTLWHQKKFRSMLHIIQPRNFMTGRSFVITLISM